MKDINNYDEFAESIAQSNADGTNKAHKYIEKPAMFASLPSLKNKKVLSIGCGTGEECLIMFNQGANVTGVDISRKSIAVAQKKLSEATFLEMDMHRLVFEDSSFDVVYSSLTLHYSEHLERVLKEVYRVLRPNGVFIFSTLHPVKWASEIRRDLEDESKKSFLLGYDSFSKPSRIYGDYLHTKSIVQKPEGYPKIKYWNRPISEYIKHVLSAGFHLDNFIEPSPINELKAVDSDYWETQSRIPQFMIFVLTK